MSKLDQNDPRAWIGAGLVMVVLGAAASGMVTDGGVGRFLLIAGAVLVAVGLVVFAVRAGTNGDRGEG